MLPDQELPLHGNHRFAKLDRRSKSRHDPFHSLILPLIRRLIGQKNGKVLTDNHRSPRANTPEPANKAPNPGADTPEPANKAPNPGADTPEPANKAPNPGADTPEPANKAPNPGADAFVGRQLR